MRWKENREITIAYPSERFDLRAPNLACGGKETLLFSPFFDEFRGSIEKAHKGTAHWFSADGEVTKDAMAQARELTFDLRAMKMSLK